jgi:hypothetical protein
MIFLLFIFVFFWKQYPLYVLFARLQLARSAISLETQIWNLENCHQPKSDEYLKIYT